MEVTIKTRIYKLNSDEFQITFNQHISMLSFLFLLFMINGFTTELFAQSVQPRWIDTPYSTYSNEQYIVAVGEGVFRPNAENAAFANLVKIFGTSVELDARSFTRMANSGTESPQMSSLSEQEIRVTALHHIENMSIAEVWQNPATKRWFALAILPRQQTAQIFKAKINDLNTVIQNYLDTAEYEEDLLYKFSLMDMAAIYAQEYENLCGYYSIVSSLPIQKEHNYRQLKAQANSIARDISFTMRTQNTNSLTQFAIEEMLATLGMRSNDINPTYIFNEKLTYQGLDTGFGAYILNYIVNIELLDTLGNRITVFTFKGKEGGTNEADALRVLQNSLAKNISQGNSTWNTNSLLAQFTAFLDSSLK